MKSTIDVDPKDQSHNTTQCKKTWLLRFTYHDTVPYTLTTSYICEIQKVG